MNNTEQEIGRAPEGWLETITANCRPQPAIPAVLVFMLSIMTPIFSLDPNSTPDHGNASWLWLLVPLGIASSCALAIAAGFCSLFPQGIWILLASWALKFTAAGGPLPAYNSYVFWAGIIACTLMLGWQIHRVRAGKFVPSIREVNEDQEPW